MAVRRFSTQLEYFLVGVLALAGLWPPHTLALPDQMQTLTRQRHNRKHQARSFVRPGLEATFFRDVSQPN
jgi:hypothetical protein